MGKVQDLIERLNLGEKWEAISEKNPLNRWLKRCWKCGSDDFSESRRNMAEKVLTAIIPLRPYRCGSCEARFFGLTSPVFNRSRAISASVMALIVIWFGASLILNSGGAEVTPEETVEVAQAENEPLEEPLPNAGEQTVAVEDAKPPEEEAETGESIDESQFSAYVLEQRRRNMAKEAAAEEPSKPAGETTAAITETPVINTAPPKPAETPVVKEPVDAKTSGAALLTGAAISQQDGKSVFLLDAAKALTVKSHFPVSARIVVDINGSWKLQGLSNTNPLNTELVKQVRFGFHASYTRVVLDLNKNISDYKVETTASGLKITIDP